MPFEVYLSSLEKHFSAIPLEEISETVKEYLELIIKFPKNLCSDTKSDLESMYKTIG